MESDVLSIEVYELQMWDCSSSDCDATQQICFHQI